MAIEVITEFTRKSSVRTIAYVKDDDGNLVNATNVSVIIVDPDGNTEINNVNMTCTGTGIYEHYLYTNVAMPLDEWLGEVWVTDDSKVSHTDFGFTLEEGL